MIIVEHATLHQSVPIKGWGAPEKTLHKTRMPGIEMELLPMGLVIRIPVKDKKGEYHRTLVPTPNVAAMQYTEVEDKKSKVDKK
jgi:hypothetical protein